MFMEYFAGRRLQLLGYQTALTTSKGRKSGHSLKRLRENKMNSAGQRELYVNLPHSKQNAILLLYFKEMVLLSPSKANATSV